MEVNANHWKSMEINGNLWKSMEVNANQWKSMEINGGHKSVKVSGLDEPRREARNDINYMFDLFCLYVFFGLFQAGWKLL